MVILSLLTGVLADHMNTVRSQEEQEAQARRQGELQKLRETEFKAFQMGDVAGRNVIDKEQFSHMFEGDGLRQELEDIGVSLDTFSAEDLFDCFDSEKNGSLKWHEFHKGMEELRIGVAPKQIFKLEVALRQSVRRCLEDTRTSTSKVKGSGHASETERQLRTAAARMARLDRELTRFGEELDAFGPRGSEPGTPASVRSAAT